MKRWAIVVLVMWSMTSRCLADEGMWLPLLIDRLNYTDMEHCGLQLTPEEIYSVNHSSLKDAIVSMGGGFCTGEIISKEGLLLTNHHCGYDYIQSHSTENNDLLTNGFWSFTKDQELANPGLYVQFLIRMDDVTKKVLKNVRDDMSETERQHVIGRTIDDIIADTKINSDYDIEIKPFFEGNEYYMFVYETYYDVRLVGAPPESIGKFGGETDNWMWPRHNGDFSLFRVYTGPDGKPAKYSPDNIPLKPKYFLPISLEGVQEKDFAMVLGYPGSTNRYLTSYGVKLALEKSNPTRVKIRQKRLEIMKEDMDASKKIRLDYAAKYAAVSNYWKYYIGLSNGLQKFDIYDQRKNLEDKFTDWLKAKKSRENKFGDPVAMIASAYPDVEKYSIPYYYLLEAGFGIEMIKFGYRFRSILQLLSAQKVNWDELGIELDYRRQVAKDFFKDYNPDTDKKEFAALLSMFYHDVPKEFQPKAFDAVEITHGPNDRFFKDFQVDKQGDFQSLANYIYNNSILVDANKLNTFLTNPEKTVLENDPGYLFASSVYDAYRSISIKRGLALEKLDQGRRLFIGGLREMQPDKDFYPDANSTMRLTYGRVLSYSPRDAVQYEYFTTLKGVMEKEDPSDPEFIVPNKLKELYEDKNYGQYGENGRMHVAFITNNDIAGGNSGSPVLNSKGELIGVAFDGNWEAMSSDVAFEPAVQRCINVDIRYVLFIIDKYAGATNLINEMKLIKTSAVKTDHSKKVLINEG